MTNTPELCFNVWVFVDPATRVVQSASAKAYALAGEDEAKLATLRDLSATDFYTAEREPIPPKYSVVAPDGRQIPGVLFAGQIPQTDLALEIIETLDPMPAQLAMREGEPVGVTLTVPDGPLHVLTFVEERADGSLVAVGVKG